MDDRERKEIIDTLKGHYPFRKLPEQDIQSFIDQSELITYSDGDILYKENEDARYLYVLIQGIVRFSEEKKGEEQFLAQLGTGDLFGYEMLGGSAPRIVKAATVGKTVLLRIDQPVMQVYIEQVSAITGPLQILYDSYYFAIKKKFDWIKPDEIVYFMSRRHWVILVLHLIPWFLFGIISIPLASLFYLNTGMSTAGILLGICLLIVLLWGIWVVVDWSNDYSVITNRRVSFQEKVVLLYTSRTEVPLNMILSVSTGTDLLGRLLSYGDVLVRTYAGLITLPNVKNPKEVADLLEATWWWARITRSKEDKAELAKVIRKRLGYDRNSNQIETKPVEPTTEKGALSSAITNMFRMRTQKGSVITYRKHWFILIEKVFFPTLTIFALFFLESLRVSGYFAYISASTFSALIFLGLIIAGGWWLYAYVDWHNDYFVVTEDQILDVYKKPLGREQRQVAPIKNIQSIEFDRHGIFGILLNFGNVYIRIGDASMVFADIYNPSEAQQDLFRRYSELDYKLKQEEAAGDRERVLEMLQIYHRVVEEEDLYKDPPPPNLN